MIAAYEAAYPETQMNDGQAHTYELHKVNMPNAIEEMPQQAIPTNWVDNAGSFNLLPNPTTNQVKVAYHLPNENVAQATITLMDITGKIIHTISLVNPIQEGMMDMDLSDLNSGIYLVNVTSEGYTQTKKLVVNK